MKLSLWAVQMSLSDQNQSKRPISGSMRPRDFQAGILGPAGIRRTPNKSLNEGLAMNIKSHINKSVADFVSWRRHRHARPELAYKEEETAAFLAAKLRGFGLEVKEGIGGTGVVGVLRRGNGPMVALRADMDALPITEATGLPYASQNAGVMHACGHDGHTAMLLGAAQNSRRDAAGEWHHRLHFPTRGGGRSRRQSHDRGWVVSRFSSGLRLRPTQLAGHPGRAIRGASRHSDGCVRYVRTTQRCCERP